MAFLEMNGLTLSVPEAGRGRKIAADQITFSMQEGEILGIVGESGSGKSITALSILGLNAEEIQIEAGSIVFEDDELLDNKEKDWLALRGSRISMIFQEPMTSLNPVMKAGPQVEEMLLLHEPALAKEQRKSRVLEIFAEVGLKDPEEVFDQYPHRLSGGMQQRVMIAMAMICKPKLLIADEPTTALDASVQDQILALMRKLNESYGVSILLISHDLRVIHSICSHVLVMKAGRIVEQGEIEAVFYHPKETYTKNLLAAIPTSTEDDFLKREQNLSQEAEVTFAVKDLTKSFLIKGERLFGPKTRQVIFQDLSFEVKKGEFVGLLGESGCGKSTLCKCICGLEMPDVGEITFPQAVRENRKPRISMVFQNPYSSMNPVKKVGWILEEPLRLSHVPAETRSARVKAMMEKVGLDETFAKRRMDQLSGGQRQRVAIGLALMEEPDLVILDEPVSALDVTIQAQILALLKQLKKELGLTFLFVSHDKNVVYEVCDRIFRMEEGSLREVTGKESEQ